jgi:hypothetical protein
MFYINIKEEAGQEQSGLYTGMRRKAHSCMWPLNRPSGQYLIGRHHTGIDMIGDVAMQHPVPGIVGFHIGRNHRGRKKV